MKSNVQSFLAIYDYKKYLIEKNRRNVFTGKEIKVYLKTFESEASHNGFTPGWTLVKPDFA